MPERSPLPLLPGRLASHDCFPAGRAGLAAREVALPDGERVRVVTSHPAAGPPPDALPVLFLHGWGCSAFSWHRTLEPVAAAGHPVFAPDLRGHGWSDKPLAHAAYTLDAMVDWARGLLDALALGRALVVAHSMGGAIALRLAQREPARVAGLVLAAPVGFGAVARTRWLRALTPALVAPLLPRLATRALVAVGLRMGYGTVGTPGERDVDEYWAPTADPRFARAMWHLSHAFDWGPEDAGALAALGVPVHALFGGRDDLIRADLAAPLLARLADAQIEVVPGAGHVIPEETPERFVAAVLGAATRAATADARVGGDAVLVGERGAA